jgi:hypothetical protein
MDHVLDFADQATRLATILTCRDYSGLAHQLYRDIVISTPRQLRAFKRTVQLGMEDPSVAAHFYHTISFYYRIRQDFSTVPLRKAGAALAKGKKLYLSLGEIPGWTAEGVQLFPNLRKATFDPLPAVESFEIDVPEQPSFLSTVRNVDLYHSEISPYDKPPLFRAIGIREAREVHMYHLAGAEISNESDLDRYFGYQPKLRTMHFHLADNSNYAIGLPLSLEEEDEAVPVPTLLTDGGQQVTTIQARSPEMDLYAREYVDAVAFAVFVFAYVRRLPSAFVEVLQSSQAHHARHTVPFPDLQRVEVELGPETDATQNEMVEDLKTKVGPFKRYYALGEQTPEVVIRRVGSTKGLLLPGKATTEDEWKGDMEAWEDLPG